MTENNGCSLSFFMIDMELHFILLFECYDKFFCIQVR